MNEFPLPESRALLKSLVRAQASLEWTWGDDQDTVVARFAADPERDDDVHPERFWALRGLAVYVWRVERATSGGAADGVAFFVSVQSASSPEDNAGIALRESRFRDEPPGALETLFAAVAAKLPNYAKRRRRRKAPPTLLVALARRALHEIAHAASLDQG